MVAWYKLNKKHEQRLDTQRIRTQPLQLQQRAGEIIKIIEGEMNKKYQIIYADPPWEERGGGKIKRGADKHYPTMKVLDIKNLYHKLAPHLDENCHMYLWVTNSFLKQGLEVMDWWGFDYKTMITWGKDRFGLGQYFRGMTEHCLFGVKGFIPYKVENGKRQQGTTLFLEKRTTHSTKPQKMREFIEKVSDREGFNKLELFAREKIEGWDTWGNEVENDIDLLQYDKI